MSPPPKMSPVTRLIQTLLILHALLNIFQGLYSLAAPASYAALASDLFAGAPDKALKSIGPSSHHSHLLLPNPKPQPFRTLHRNVEVGVKLV
jgi:hypothetical protein